jgi:DNA-binding NtrC family response regulator
MDLHQAAMPPRVLVVEDEMILRMRAVDIVEDAGFTPIEAANADEALVILESRSDVELLFTDIQMPGSMDGLKLAHAVHERWPSIKIILVSGQLAPTETETPTNSRFFGKPLEVKRMIAEMQEMIGQGTLSIDPPDIATFLANTLRIEPQNHPQMFPAELWNAPDRISRPAIEGRGADRL